MRDIERELDDARRAVIRSRLKEHFADEFEEALSDFRADGLIDLFLREAGPAIYNQAVTDVRAHLQDKLDDLDAEVFAVADGSSVKDGSR